MQTTLNIQKRFKQGGLLNSKIGKIPVQERQFRSDSKKVKEELYLYLLQRNDFLAGYGLNARY
jgi:hypothetical protein